MVALTSRELVEPNLRLRDRLFDAQVTSVIEALKEFAQGSLPGARDPRLRKLLRAAAVLPVLGSGRSGQSTPILNVLISARWRFRMATNGSSLI
jgi:hypothetical protein